MIRILASAKWFRLGVLPLAAGAALVACGDGGGSPGPSCDPAQCIAGPPPFCEGDVLVTVAATGACTAQGTCELIPSRTTCANGCTNGACAAGPCEGVTCDQPPAAACEGNVAVRYAADGVCSEEDGSCSYGATRTDCTPREQVCREGACVVPDTCEGVVCDAPPAPVCDGNRVVSYSSDGACVDGACEYTATETNCASSGQRCLNGACVERDPCEGVSCDRPPAPFCDGNSVVRSGVGACADGTCVWEQGRTDCGATGQTCLEGRCGDFDPCEGVTCDAPPLSFCTGNTAVAFGAGSCSEGACEYDEVRVDCAFLDQVCAAGVCVAGNPCEGVTCTTPPAPACEGDARVEYAASGTCARGVCSYAVASSTDCRATGDVCRGGACVDPCDGVACDVAPAPACIDGFAVTYVAPGVCAAGDCEFDARFVDCGAAGAVCDAGACVFPDLCLGVTCDRPPAADCDRDTAIYYDIPGTCDDGTCSYERVTADCAALDAYCTSGRCVPNDACEGVTCDAPPAGICRGAVAITFGAGSCIEGECAYTEFAVDCARTGQFCDDGVCVAANPCAGVVCDAPPLSRCDGTTAISYGAGTCASGDCAYAPVATDCAASGATCVAGECVAADLCEGVSCDGPLPARCDGNVAVVATAAGRCEAGRCAWPESRRDCSPLGLFCVDGVCEAADPCLGVTCSGTRTWCDGDVAVSSTSTGCADGACIESDVRTDCAATGLFCEDGACVAADPCGAVTCDTPPDPICLGPVARTYGPSATCDEGTCLWQRNDTDCTSLPARSCDGNTVVVRAAGTCAGGVCRATESRTACPPSQVCADGACVDPCAGTTCDEPPPAFCSGQTSVSFGAAGVCVAGVCEWSEVRADCRVFGQVCVDGACERPDACEGVTCTTPPAPDCDRGVAIQYENPGLCAGGFCSYVETRTDCVAGGGFCSAGACGSIDPCLGVLCGVPPLPSCRGNDRVAYEDVGECVEGLCFYDEVVTDCTDSGRFCLDGACVATDPCSGVSCTSPPAPACNGDIALSYAATGTCSAGVCAYAVLGSRDCGDEGGVCFAGVCEGTDLCDGITCDAPPAPTCEGTRALTWSSDGECRLGFCSYEPTSVDCDAIGQFCVDGACTAVDPCTGVVCDAPPTDRCNGNNAVQYDAPGVCDYGACEYAPRVVDCVAGGGFCLSGECVPADPCLGVECDFPPAPFCRGDQVVSSYFPVSCEAGACQWDETVQSCAVERPPFCDGSVAVLSVGAGECVDGACAYDEVRDDCAPRGQTCVAGACRSPDPCLGVTCDSPPADFCDGDNLMRLTGGRCVDGTCQWTPALRTDCEAARARCVGGICESIPPCAGVVCDDYPPDTCSGTRVRLVERPGTCDEGECTYRYVDGVDCAASGQVCVDGTCIDPDPCDGVVCGAAPPPYCEGDIAFTPTGETFCQAGECEFLVTSEFCGTVAYGDCEDGACIVRDPCEGVTCTEAPEPRCLGFGARVVSTPFCFDGGCTWEEEAVDCPAGETCFDGECLDAAECGAIRCATAPPPVCDLPLSPVAVTFLAPGECDDSLTLCTYDEVLFDCSVLGQTCDDGICAPLALPAPDTLAIVEMFVNPTGSDAGGEWIELQNLAETNMDLGGLVVSNAAGQSFTIPANTVILEGEPYVLTQGTGAVSPGLAYYAWGGTGVFAMQNSADTITLRYDGEVVDRISYSSPAWPLVEGRSLSLDRGAYDTAVNDDPAVWCASATPFLVGFSTPNVLNETCAVDIGIEPGDVLITELYAAAGTTEWFIELQNIAAATVNLGGVTLSTGAGAFASLPEGELFGAFDSIVIGGSASAAGGAVDIVLDGIVLDPVAGSVTLTSATDAELDVVSWDAASGWPLRAGASMQLSLGSFTTEDNDDPSRWCSDFIPFVAGLAANPGELNFNCDTYYPECDDACPALGSQCERDVAITYGGEGVCTSGRCEYAAVRSIDPCDEPGLYCALGVCAVDPRP